MEKVTPLKKKVHIYRLVLLGWRIPIIAKHLKITRQAVDKHIRILEQENLIEQTTKYPKFYQKKSEPQPPLRRLSISTSNDTHKHVCTPQIEPTANICTRLHEPAPPPLPLMLPCKYGALYNLIVKAKGGKIPGIRYNSRGMATIKDTAYTVQFGKSKAQIWLKFGGYSFQGSHPDQILAIAKQSLDALAKSFEKKYSIKLNIRRIYDDIEWAELSKKRSKAVAEKAGIEKGGSIKVGEAIHKFDDFSHPEFFQINPARNAVNKGVATDHAKTHYYLYMRLPQDMERFAKLFEKVADSITVLDQKIETVNKKVEDKP